MALYIFTALALYVAHDRRIGSRVLDSQGKVGSTHVEIT
jgi:hypothetical protein